MLMNGERALLREPHAALVALVRFLAGMNQDVLVEGALQSKRCSTCIAHVGLQLAMHLILVTLQVPLRPEPHLTRLERARVFESLPACTLMIGEVCLLREPHATLVACMRFLAGMNHDVPVEVDLLSERCSTCIAHVRLQLAMHIILVTLQAPLRPEPHLAWLERARVFES